MSYFCFVSAKKVEKVTDMAIRTLPSRDCKMMTASYGIPSFERALQQVIYNAIDAHAKAITLVLDVVNASFTVSDNGDGIQPDDLYKYVGECFASSRLQSNSSEAKAYGSRGAFLVELTSLARSVEIESRVQGRWTSYRKIFKEGKVVLNAQSKGTREASGTTISVSNLFVKLPVRKIDLARNTKYRARVIQNFRAFLASMSMIWPSLSFDVHFKNGTERPIIISATASCRERFIKHFGQLLGDELQYVKFLSETKRFSIRGYIAFIPVGNEGFSEGIKQAKTYYQFAFLENEWVVDIHQLCSQLISVAVWEFVQSIPIFVLKVGVPGEHYDASQMEKKDVLIKNPDLFREFFIEFVEHLVGVTMSQVNHSLQDSMTNEASTNGNVKHESDGLSCRQNTRFRILTLSNDYNGYEQEISRLRQNSSMSSSESTRICHACGQTDSSLEKHRKHNAFQDDLELLYEMSEASYPDTSRFICDNDPGNADVSTRDEEMGDIFFSRNVLQPCAGSPSLAETFMLSAPTTPWLSSKPDAYDCADDMLKLCDVDASRNEEQYLSTSDSNQQLKSNLNLQLELRNHAEQSHDVNYSGASNISKSDYFTGNRVRCTLSSLLRKWLRSAFVKDLGDVLRFSCAQILKEREIKISKATLARLQVICQVDRKFILVEADSSHGKLILCIDQHAADERVRLEKLEANMFGHEGSLRRVEIFQHEPPQALFINVKDHETLCQFDDLVRSWGFDFEVIATNSETISSLINANKSVEKCQVLLHATPKVEKRIISSEDFQEFIDLLSNAEGAYIHSKIRPPAITRLLHSRACRSAIMFGDRLSFGQCQDLIEELKTCQLPFQCAHGRPSVVPLAEISYDE